MALIRHKIYRVDEDQIAAVVDPESGLWVVPKPGRAYPSTHPLVRKYPWMFVCDNDVEDASDRRLGQ